MLPGSAGLYQSGRAADDFVESLIAEFGSALAVAVDGGRHGLLLLNALLACAHPNTPFSCATPLKSLRIYSRPLSSLATSLIRRLGRQPHGRRWISTVPSAGRGRKRTTRTRPPGRR